MGKNRNARKETRQKQEKITVRYATKAVIIIINALAAIVPLCAFTIMPVLGLNLTLLHKSDDGVTSIDIGALVYLIVFGAISVAVIVISSYLSTKDFEIISKSKYKELQEKKAMADANNEILTNFLDAFGELCQNKNRTLYDVLKNCKSKQKSYSGMIATRPEQQIQNIFKTQMNKMLENFIDLKKHSIAVSVAYHVDNGAWKWFEGCEPDDEWDANKLATKDDSVFYEILHSQSGYVLYNSKKEAAKNNHYYFSTEEEEEGTDGSIIGRRISFGEYSDHSTEVVYFFTTSADIKLVPNVDNRHRLVRELKTRLGNNFFREFDERIKIEFSLFFLDKYT